ncbi:MAG: hypothetical protein ACETWM_16700 [Candidatus Lokiarchaeia archaeon]
MFKKTITSGVLGGVLGLAAANVAFYWSLIFLHFEVELRNYRSFIGSFWSYLDSFTEWAFSGYSGIITTLIFPYPPSSELFLYLSILLALLIFSFSIMISFGLYRIYSHGGYKIDLAILLLIIILTMFAGMLIIMGGLLKITIVDVLSPFTPGDFLILRIPAVSYTWMGDSIFGVVLGILGLASARTYKSVEREKEALIAGILSIIGGIALTIHLLLLLLPTYEKMILGYQTALFGSFFVTWVPMSIGLLNVIFDALMFGTVYFLILTSISFGAILIASVLWIRVFLGSVMIIIYCSVCRKVIITGKDTLVCPNCGALSHRSHILEWLKVKGTCPSCGKSLRGEQLYPYPVKMKGKQ